MAFKKTAFRKHRRKIADLMRGLSVVEITGAIGIIGIISIMIVSIYFAHFKLFSNQSKTIDIANETRIALDTITNQIREASGVVSTCPGTSPYNGCGSATTSSTVLVLQLWPLDSNGDPTDPGTTNFDYIVIKRDDLENTKLTRQIFPSAISSRQAKTDILSTDVANNGLTFDYDNADFTQAGEITVTLTNTATQFGKAYTQTQETKAVIRNK